MKLIAVNAISFVEINRDGSYFHPRLWLREQTRTKEKNRDGSYFFSAILSGEAGMVEDMPRRARAAVGGVVYHVLNRGCGRMKLFTRDRDYAAFEAVLAEAVRREPVMRLLSYCVMPNHWHLVLCRGATATCPGSCSG
jgi:hypothetical protein